MRLLSRAARVGNKIEGTLRARKSRILNRAAVGLWTYKSEFAVYVDFNLLLAMKYAGISCITEYEDFSLVCPNPLRNSTQKLVSKQSASKCSFKT